MIEQVESTVARLTESFWNKAALFVDTHPKLMVFLVLAAAFGPLLLVGGLY